MASRTIWAVMIAVCVALFVTGLGLGAVAVGRKSATTVDRTQTQTQTQTDTVTQTNTVSTTIVRTVVHKVKPSTAPNRGVTISYGQWGGLFKLIGAHIVDDGYGNYSIAGQLEYLGGGTCKPGYTEVDGVFRIGKTITDSSGLWNAQQMPANVPVPFSMIYSGSGAPTSAQLVLTQVQCQ